MVIERVLLVFASAEERQAACLFEPSALPFSVGHLEKPQLLLTAVAKIKPALVIFYLGNPEIMLAECARLQAADGFNGLIVLFFPREDASNSKIALTAGADGMLEGGVAESDLVVRIKSLLKTRRVYAENFRRAQAVARANAEAADMVLKLEEANKKIREQNDRIVMQQQRISEHLEQANRELEIAARLQISLLPKSNVITTNLPLILRECYIPAMKLGGDYFDYMRLSKDRLLICVADVTGHGIAPALVSVQMRSLARVHFLNKSDLTSVIATLNQFMCSTFRLSFLMTMVAMAYCPHTGEVEMVNAGHCPPMHYRQGEPVVEEYASPNLPLGVLEHATFSAQKFTLGIHDRLLLYSDGITEAANDAGEEFGTDRMRTELVKAVNSADNNPPFELLRCASEFSGRQSFNDDVTMVLLQRLPNK